VLSCLQINLLGAFGKFGTIQNGIGPTTMDYYRQLEIGKCSSTWKHHPLPHRGEKSTGNKPGSVVAGVRGGDSE
jgi:hypothetical protein